MKQKTINTLRCTLRSSYYKSKHYENLITNYTRLILDDLQNGDVESTLGEKFQYWRKGFTSQEANLFNFDKHNHKDYISGHDLSMYRAGINHNTFTKNKVAFYHLINKNHSNLVPNIYGVLNKRDVHSIDGEYLANDVKSWLEKILQYNGTLVCKPIEGWGGKEIHIVRNETDAQEFIKPGIDSEYMIMEYIKPSKYIRNIYPNSANAVRITTIWDYERNKPFIGCANQRIGTDLSAPADNFTAGGLSAQINRSSGKLSKAAMISKNEIEWHSKHPNTGNQIEGIIVKDWEEVKSKILDVTKQLNYIPLISWDLIISNDGLKVLEGNAVPGFKTEQVHKPLLSDERIRRYFVETGIDV